MAEGKLHHAQQMTTTLLVITRRAGQGGEAARGEGAVQWCRAGREGGLPRVHDCRERCAWSVEHKATRGREAGECAHTWLRISLSASGLLSPMTFRKATFLYCSLNSSNLGAMILHGPHHEVE